MRRLAYAIAGGMLAAAGLVAAPAWAQKKTEITFARFFGACEADYGSSQDVAHARGECGVMTTLVNLFNATNKDNIVVKPQIIEWGPYYQQLNARLAAHDIPSIAVMHSAQLGDYTRYVEPLDDALKEAGIDAGRFHAERPQRRHRRRQDLRDAVGHAFLAVALQRRPVQEGRACRMRRGSRSSRRRVDEMIAQSKQMTEKTGKPYIDIAIDRDAGRLRQRPRSFYSWLYDQNGTIFPGGYDKADFKTPAVARRRPRVRAAGEGRRDHEGSRHLRRPDRPSSTAAARSI